MRFPGFLPRTVQLCVHCQHNRAGFWVARTSATVVRRPWCLACCAGLDRARCVIIPFDATPRISHRSDRRGAETSR